MWITEKEANRTFNRRHKVSRLRQWWFGSTTIGRNHFIRPCRAVTAMIEPLNCARRRVSSSACANAVMWSSWDDPSQR